MVKNQEVEESNAKLFELGFLVSPAASEEEAQSLFLEISSSIEKEGGKNLQTSTPILRPLAYGIKRKEGEESERAYFGSITFEAPLSLAKDKETGLKANPQVLRSLLITLPKEALAQKERRVTGSIQRPKKAERSEEPISEAEIDKTIEELVIE